MKSALVFFAAVIVSVIAAMWISYSVNAREPWPCDKSVVYDQYERFDNLRSSALKAQSIANMLKGEDRDSWNRTATQAIEYARELKKELEGCGIVVFLQ